MPGKNSCSAMYEAFIKSILEDILVSESECFFMLSFPFVMVGFYSGICVEGMYNCITQCSECMRVAAGTFQKTRLTQDATLGSG